MPATPLHPPDLALPLPSGAHWRSLATAAAADFQARLATTHYVQLTERDRARLARRLREAIESALRVPPDLAARLAAEAAPGGEPVDEAWARVRERARRSAAIGAVTTLPAMMPGLGTALAGLGLVADWRYGAEQQRDLVLEVAALFGVPLADPTGEARALFLAGACAMAGVVPSAEAVVRVLAEQVAQRSVARVVPGAGAVLASAFNYLTTVAIGRVALQRYGHEAGVPAERLPAPPTVLQGRLEQVLINAVRRADHGEAEEPFTREEDAALAALPQAERRVLLELAVVSAAAQGGVSAEEGAVLHRITGHLGFPEAELAAQIAAARADLAAASTRFRALFDQGSDTTTGVTRLVWRRTRELARNG